VRRLSSIFASVAIVASALTFSSSVASAAGGTATVTRSANMAPSSIANATPLRMARLEKSNSFLVVGRNLSAAGSNLYLWKVKEDLTFDSSFGAIDLGTHFSAPTSSNSTCVTSNGNGCSNVQGFVVNEVADVFMVSFRRMLKGSGSSSSSDMPIFSVLTGKVSTGAVIAQSRIIDTAYSSSATLSDWSSYSAAATGKDACTAAHGATLNSAPLQWSYLNFYQSVIRGDGSFILSVDCNYTNDYNVTPSAIKNYDAPLLIAMKPSNGSFAIDATFGTNGYVKLLNPLTECGDPAPASTFDSSVTTNSSTKIFFIAMLSTFARTTTIPNNYSSNPNVTSYDGCSSFGMTQRTAKIVSIQANGTVKKSITYPTGKDFFASRWVIDPQGRWNTTVSILNPNSPSSAPTYVRIAADGTQDTTIGANGMKELTGLPATISVNGTSVSMRYSVSGLATTANGTYFVGFASTGNQSCNYPYSGTTTNTTYPYYFTPESGLVTTYGTNGLGDAFTSVSNNVDTCTGNSLAGISYINSEGRPAALRSTAAIGQQASGLTYVLWDAAQGVVGGGDGTVSSATSNRIDKKVYSTSLPKATQADSALTVLTAKQAEDLDIRTNTPKICIALTTSVVMVNPGRCSVRIIDEDTKKVIRTMTTIVKKTEVEDGTTLTTDEPIYFRQASTRLSKNALAQVAELAEAAKDAARVVVIGHSAALGEVSEYSYAISRNRANAVKAALIKAGVKTPIEIVAMSYSQPEKTAKTEKAQALNRRAEVYIFPK